MKRLKVNDFFQFSNQIHSQTDKNFCRFITKKIYEEVTSFPRSLISLFFAASAKKEKKQMH